MLLTCQTIYGKERGAQLVAFLEQSTGEPCPCKQGQPCPLMPPEPRASAELETLPDPLHRLPQGLATDGLVAQ